MAIIVGCDRRIPWESTMTVETLKNLSRLQRFTLINSAGIILMQVNEDTYEVLRGFKQLEKNEKAIFLVIRRTDDIDKLRWLHTYLEESQKLNDEIKYGLFIFVAVFFQAMFLWKMGFL